MKKLIFSFATMALAVASAASYNVTIFSPVQIGDQTVKPGEYKVELHDNTASFVHGKQHVDFPVRVEQTDNKFSATSLRLGEGSQVQEIRLRGTNTKLVVGGENASKDKPAGNSGS